MSDPKASSQDNSPMPFPWAAIMAFGFGVMKLSPEDFWQMTPREIGAAMRGALGLSGTPRMDSTRLASLMSRFPDK